MIHIAADYVLRLSAGALSSLSQRSTYTEDTEDKLTSASFNFKTLKYCRLCHFYWMYVDTGFFFCIIDTELGVIC